MRINSPSLRPTCISSARKHLQMSPKEVLDKQTVTEIKTYLVNTDIPVKGIADELCFNDYVLYVPLFPPDNRNVAYGLS